MDLSDTDSSSAGTIFGSDAEYSCDNLNIDETAIVPSIRTRFHESINRQNFSFHNTLMFYITENPSSAKVYQNLIKTCKYFFYKNPIVFMPYLYSDSSSDGWYNGIRTKLKNISCKVWVTVKIDMETRGGGKDNRDWITFLIPKIYQSDIKKFYFWKQNISLNDLIFLAARKCKKIRFSCITVFDDDGDTALEKIIEVLPKLRNLDYDLIGTPPNLISTVTVENLLKIRHFSKFTHFCLDYIPDSFDAYFLQKLGKHHNHAVLFLMGSYNSPAPEIATVSPTAIFDVIIQAPLQIDKICNVLPPSLIKASLYVPGTPQRSDEEKIRYLSKKAMENECTLASAMNISDCYSMAKLAENSDQALIYCCSYEVTHLYLQDLSFYKNITVIGESNLKKLVQQRVEQPVADAGADLVEEGNENTGSTEELE